MCWSQYPPNFVEKNGKDQNSVSCTKKNSLFLVSTRNDNIPKGCATKMEFPGKILSMGGMDIFGNYTTEKSEVTWSSSSLLLN